MTLVCVILAKTLHIVWRAQLKCQHRYLTSKISHEAHTGNMALECPNQQQICDPIRGLPYNPSGIPFIDEDVEDDPHPHQTRVVCNDLRSPEAEGLIGNSAPKRTSEKRRKANDVRITMPGEVATQRGSIRRSLKGLAEKVRRNSVLSSTAEGSDGRGGSRCTKPGCRATVMSILLSGSYFMLAVIAAVVTYSMLAHLVHSFRHPVRSTKYKQVEEHEAPAIVIYPGSAVFPGCGQYFQNVDRSRGADDTDVGVSLSQLDLVNRNCSYLNLTYEDPHNPGVFRNALIIRGPSKVLEREAVFLHFRLVDPSRDFFTLSYFLFPGWDRFNESSEEDQLSELFDRLESAPTFDVSAGLRFWTKLSVKETYFFDDKRHIEFKTEYSVVKHWNTRTLEERNRTRLFFVFFEWKNNLIEQTELFYTTSAWSTGAGLCAVFLTLHKAYTLLKASVKRAKREKRKRKYASLNSKKPDDNHECQCQCQVPDKIQSCDNET